MNNLHKPYVSLKYTIRQMHFLKYLVKQGMDNLSKKFSVFFFIPCFDMHDIIDMQNSIALARDVEIALKFAHILKINNI